MLNKCRGKYVAMVGGDGEVKHCAAAGFLKYATKNPMGTHCGLEGSYASVAEEFGDQGF